MLLSMLFLALAFPSGENLRRSGGAGEYLNGKNLHSLSLYLNG